MIDYQSLKLLIFDADDTLWDCQSHFDEAMRQCAEILQQYVTPDEVERQLYETEKRNMPITGYGTKAFTLSLIENALKTSRYQASAKEIEQILMLGKNLLFLPATPLEGVEETLSALKSSERYVLVLFTKGETIDQKGKIQRSGLSKYFDEIIIVDDKTDDEYRNICTLCGVNPNEMLMIGNSFKSDIAPALRIGSNAVYLPFHVTWALEHAETFEHDHLVTLSSISELKPLLL